MTESLLRAALKEMISVFENIDDIMPHEEDAIANARAALSAESEAQTNAARGRPEYGGKYADLHKHIQLGNAPPFKNCSYANCDLPGQCIDEGKCHHPIAAPTQPPFPNCLYTHCDLPGQCVGEGACHHPKPPAGDTPRTDKEKVDLQEVICFERVEGRNRYVEEYVPVNFCRKLERELAAAKATIDAIGEDRSELDKACNDYRESLAALQSRLDSVELPPEPDEVGQSLIMETATEIRIGDRWESIQSVKEAGDNGDAMAALAYKSVLNRLAMLPIAKYARTLRQHCAALSVKCEGLEKNDKRYRWWRKHWFVLCRMEVAASVGLNLFKSSVSNETEFDAITDAAIAQGEKA